MQLRRINQPLVLAAALGLAAAGGLVVAGPAQAQQQDGQAQQTGERYQVLVPVPEHGKDVDDDFGEDMAKALRKSIDKMPRHVSVTDDALDDALDKYHLDKNELDCIKSRQLAVQMGAKLVMCGTYKPTATKDVYDVTASFVGAKNGETFKVPPFTANDPDSAAKTILTSFSTYVTQLGLLKYCQDYLSSQNWTHALEDCNKALAVNPESPRGLYGAGRALMELDSLPQAYAKMQKVIEVDPLNQSGLRAAGILAAELGKQQESRQYFKQYLELNPGAAQVRLSLASDAAKAGDPIGALHMLEGGIKADTTGTPNAQLLLYAGHWALAAGQKADSVAKAAKDTTSTRADSLYSVALGYYQTLYAQKDTATDLSAIRNMMIVLTQQDKAQQATTIGAKFVALQPHDAGLWSVYADALHTAGQLDQALDALDSAVAYDTANAYPVYAKRGQWLATAGRLEEADTAFQEAAQRGTITLDQAAQMIFGIGYNQHYTQGDVAGALKYLTSAHELATTPMTQGMVNFWTGYIYFNQASSVQKANPKKASPKAAGLYRKALTYLGQTDAYAAANPQVAGQIKKLVDYAHSYIDAVNKAKGQ